MYNVVKIIKLCIIELDTKIFKKLYEVKLEVICLKTAIDCKAIFDKYNGIMQTCELTKEGIFYQTLQGLIADGSVEKIKYGYYQWQDEKASSEAVIIASLFPEAIICDMSAAMYYGYTDRVSGVWHIAVDNRTARNKFKLTFPEIKPHFIEKDRLEIGAGIATIDDVTVRIYDRERLTCDFLRRMNTVDGEIFNTIIKRYVADKEKNPAKLMEYASVLGVEKKARRVIGVWL